MTAIPGIETFLSSPSAWIQPGDRVGVLSNPTGIDRQLRSTVDLLKNHPDINLVRLFGPEHGIRGDAQAGVSIEDTIDERTQLPVVSLYTRNRTLTSDVFEGLDVVLVDLQDVGVRFYTNVAWADRFVRMADEAGARAVVLDRPNPISWMGAFGNRVASGHSSSVGMETLPVAHAATIGELIRYLARKDDRRVPDVVPVEHWDRTTRWEDTNLPWVSPSPNLPTLDSVHLYPVSCWLEGTTLSEGRGTTRPFEIVGSPDIDGYALAEQLQNHQLNGYGYRPTSFQPTFSKHAGAVCHGIQIHPMPEHSAEVLALGPHLLAHCWELADDNVDWIVFSEIPFIDRLGGSAALREAVTQGREIDELLESWKPETADFIDDITPDLIYGPISAA